MRTLFPRRVWATAWPCDHPAPRRNWPRCVAGPQGLARSVSLLVVPGTTAERPRCSPWASGYALCRSCSHHGSGGHGDRVRRWLRNKSGPVGGPQPQMPVTSTLYDQAHNAIERKLFAMKGPVIPKEAGGVSPRALPRSPSSSVSAPGLACWPAWRGNGGRAIPHTRRMLNRQILTSGGFR